CVGDGHGMIAGAHCCDTAVESRPRQAEHHVERSAGLEGAGELKQLELEKNRRLRAHRLLQGVAAPMPHRGLGDERSKSLFRSPYLGKRRGTMLFGHAWRLP